MKTSILYAFGGALVLELRRHHIVILMVKLPLARARSKLLHIIVAVPQCSRQ